MTALWLAKFTALLGIGAGLAIALVLLDRAVSRSAGSTGSRGTLHKFFPLLALGVLGCYAMLLIGHILHARGPFAYAVAAVLGLIALSVLRPMKDVFSGIWLRAEGILRPGAIVALGGARGRVRFLGVRSFEMDGRDGSIERIPYGLAARARLSRLMLDGGISAHTLLVNMPMESPETFRERIRLSILNHPCTPVRRPPVMRIVSTDLESAKLEVTLYAATAEHAARVEAAIRTALAEDASEDGQRSVVRNVTRPAP